MGKNCLIELKTIRQIRKARFPLNGNQVINLSQAFAALSSVDFVVSYNPEVTPIGLYVKRDDIPFRVFSNGTVVVYGLASVQRQARVLTGFWNEFLHDFVVRNPTL